MADPVLPPGFLLVDPNRLDRRTGAPAGVRAAVGAAQTPEDRLSTLRKFAPDAAAYGDDNFTFANPATGRQTLYNPKGLDWGDFASLVPEMGEFAGGAIGGTAAALPGVAGAPVTGGASLAAIPVGAGLGAAGGRELATLYANKVLGTDDTRGLGTRLGGAAATAGMNAIGARVGDLVGQGVSAAVGPVRSALGGRTGADVMDDFAAQGVRPTAGAVTGNRGIQMVEKGLAATPGGGRVIQDIAKQQWDDIARAAGDITAEYGTPMSPQGAGGVIRQGAEGAAGRFKARQGQLYDAAYDLVGRDTPVDPTATKLLLDSFESRLAEAPESMSGALGPAMKRAKGLISDSDAAPIGMDTWRRIRTDIGRDLKSPMLAGSTSSQNDNLNALYGAMSQDMGATTKAAGPAAERALTLADRYTRFNMNINMPTLQKIADLGADEKAYQYALSEAKNGGSRLMTLRKNFKQDEWGTVAASVLDRMGLATPGVRGAAELGGAGNDFSVSTFMTNWGRLSDEAKNALFSGPGFKETRESLDQLVRVMNRVKDVERMGNPSGTGRTLLTGTALGSAGTMALSGDVVGAGGALLGVTALPYVNAKMITNPAFVRWLSGAGAMGVKNGPSKEAMVGRLAAIAEANPEIRDETLRLRDALRSASPTGRAQ